MRPVHLRFPLLKSKALHTIDVAPVREAKRDASSETQVWRGEQRTESAPSQFAALEIVVLKRTAKHALVTKRSQSGIVLLRYCVETLW